MQRHDGLAWKHGRVEEQDAQVQKLKEVITMKEKEELKNKDGHKDGRPREMLFLWGLSRTLDQSWPKQVDFIVFVFCKTAARLNTMHAGHMHSGWDHCYPNCTPMTMMVQPPPLTLSIMSPAHYSPGHPACIKPHNPCAPVHCWDGRSHYGHHGLTQGAAPCFTSTSQKCLPKSKSGYVPCRTY
ncbi:hypothetical protein L345_16115, partial [Ophiophagus hannah]